MDGSILKYAYLGDAIYELYVRKYLISKNICKLKDLQEESLKFVTAKRQAYFVKCLEEGFLTELETDIIRRGRNLKTNSKPKSCDIVTYRYATGLEVLFGYFYSIKKEDRLDEIFNEIVRL